MDWSFVTPMVPGELYAWLSHVAMKFDPNK